jgi:hypothetical protein
VRETVGSEATNPPPRQSFVEPTTASAGGNCPRATYAVTVDGLTNGASVTTKLRIWLTVLLTLIVLMIIGFAYI